MIRSDLILVRPQRSVRVPAVESRNRSARDRTDHGAETAKYEWGRNLCAGVVIRVDLHPHRHSQPKADQGSDRGVAAIHGACPHLGVGPSGISRLPWIATYGPASPHLSKQFGIVSSAVGVAGCGLALQVLTPRRDNFCVTRSIG